MNVDGQEMIRGAFKAIKNENEDEIKNRIDNKIEEGATYYTNNQDKKQINPNLKYNEISDMNYKAYNTFTNQLRDSNDNTQIAYTQNIGFVYFIYII